MPGDRRAVRIEGPVASAGVNAATDSLHRDTPGSSKIAKVEAWPVNVPLDFPYLFAIGTYRGLSHTIVRLTTDDGLVGLGEAFSWRDAAIVEALAEQIVGRRCDELRADLAGAITAPRNAYAQFEGVTTERAWAAIEIALWDIAAKAVAKPLYELFGGAVRTAVPVTEYFAYRLGTDETPEQIAAFCGRMVEEFDSPSFEGKVATMPPADELRMLRLVRDAVGPDREIRLDGNLGWKLSTAIEWMPALHDLGISGIEEPVGTWEEMAELRKHTSIPFSAHEPDFEAQARLGVPDTFVLSVLSCGGFTRTLETIERCRHAGVGFWFYSGEMGIATAACLHVGAAVGHVGRSQSLLRWHADDVIEGGPTRPDGGLVQVPDGPGLGVELDEVALQRCVERFADEGAYVIYDAPPVPRY